MSDNEDQSPYGRGFVAACIVIAAILLCGALLLITGLTANPADTADPSVSTTTSTGTAPSPDPGPTATAEPVSASKTGAAGACGLPDGDQAVPAKAPSVDVWEVSRRVVVPRSAVHGPAKVDPDGFRRCFAHSPSGAVYAAYNAIAAMGDQAKGIDTVGKLMLPGPDRDALIRELREETPDDVSEPTQLAGYRVLDASRDRATVTLALPVESEYVSATLTFVWQSGDWRLVPPAPGESVGAPYSQHADLAGFVAWSGV